MKINQQALGNACPVCRKTITQDSIDLLSMIKKENAKASAKKAKLNGTKLGPKVKWDVAEAVSMRKKHKTLTYIAKVFSISRQTVSRKFKQMGIK